MDLRKIIWGQVEKIANGEVTAQGCYTVKALFSPHSIKSLPIYVKFERKDCPFV